MNQLQGSIRHRILNENLWRIIPFLVFPLLTSGFLNMAWNFMNGFWVGKLGPVEFAAVNISSFFIWSYFAIIDIIRTGTTSLVARYDGANLKAKALDTAHQGIRSVFLLSIAYSLTMLFFSPTFFKMMGAESSVIKEAYRYICVLFLFLPIISFQDAIVAILKGYGDTKTPMNIFITAFIIMMVLDPILILGIGPFPQMGAAGGAVATVFSFLTSMIYLIIFLNKREGKFTLRKKFYPPNYPLIKEIVKIGLPLSINSLTFSAVAVFIGAMVASFGTESVAALGIGHRVESLSFLFCSAFSSACLTLVGQNLGAKQNLRARQSTEISLIYALVFTILTSILFYLFSWNLARFFIEDPLTIQEADKYLKIISYSQIAMGLNIVLDGFFAGIGKTFIPMALTIPIVLLRIPFAWLLAFHTGLGITGIWWSITILTILKALLYYIYFQYETRKFQSVI